MNHKGTVTLETERLILRRFTMDDVTDAYNNWLSDPDVAMYMQWDAHTDVNQTQEWVSRYYVENYEKNNFYRWAIALKKDNKVIGSVGFNIEREYDSVADVSYALCKRFWNKGIMSEALIAVVAYAFNEVKINRLEAFHAVANPSSGKVLQKSGMKYEGHARQKYRNRLRGFEDCDLYSILADDYFGKNKAEISIVPYERKYHDDMLFCFLATKDAIGKYAPDPQWSKPTLKDDLIDIEKYYIGQGDVFYLAIDKRDRVVGMIGTQTTSPMELWLKRLFIKPDLKGKGIGSKLLSAIVDYAAGKGVTEIHTRFASWYREAAVFYPAKGFVEIEPDDYLRHMVKRLR
ncbi:MAG: GNAT family N-acetyltransferase [Oscillospiraceae bacterium]|jgi:ribosomal-protein-alanine N-acetyltransferase|nr:GNAT family N-acetyltransferase [Oscillospiraceae bacterium]